MVSKQPTMALCNPFLNFSEQLGYVQCSFCSTILLVSVPCSSLLNMVTVRCGHCTGLLSVSIDPSPSFLPFQSLSPLSSSNQEDKDANCINDTLLKACDRKGEYQEEDQEEESSDIVSLVNKPPEKRQRAPSAYNHFIKEEIKRIKATEPNMSHKEAFSTAAKNVSSSTTLGSVPSDPVQGQRQLRFKREHFEIVGRTTDSTN